MGGKLESDVEFSFTLKKKPISVAKFDLKLSNNSILKVCCFDDNADFCYKKLKIDDWVIIAGRINTDLVVIAENIYNVL